MPLEVAAMRLTTDGFEIAFTRAVDQAAATDLAAYALRTYFYNYHEQYGSAKYDAREVKITAVDVSEDRLRVTLHLDALEAWRLYDLKLSGIIGEDGEHVLVSPWVVYT